MAWSILCRCRFNLTKAYPSPGNSTETTKYVHSLYKHFDIDNMKRFLTAFSGFRTRYYRSDTGKQSQKFLLQEIQSIIKGHKGMSVKEFEHPWGQNSIIVRFAPGKSSVKADAPVTVLGAHQDSTNSWPFFAAP